MSQSQLKPHVMMVSMLRELTYSGIRMGTYEYFKSSIHGLAPGTLATDGLTLKVLAASVAATLGSAVANPTDLVKGLSLLLSACRRTTLPARLNALRDTRLPASGASCLRALYRGTDATTLRGVVLSVSQSLKRRGVMQEGLALHFTASMLAGFICSTTSNPVGSFAGPLLNLFIFTRCVIGLKHARVDVVKVRVMNDKEHKFGNVLDWVQTMLRQEGPMAFYKGFSMCWARVHFIRLRLRSLNLEPIQTLKSCWVHTQCFVSW
ncbi:mitochondrial carrier domain-containing protein [Lactarius hatsudake]|nr:mitochondrial carrier domain-containing protein [Lactarius hatsudake]